MATSTADPTAQRRARLLERLRERDLAGLLVTGAANRRYITGFTGSAGVALITPERSWLFVDFRYTEQARLQAPGVEVVQYEELYPALHQTARDALHAGPIGVESAHMTLAQWNELSQKLPGIDWKPVEGIVEGLRAVKEPGELEALERAISLADDAFAHIVGWLRPGQTEREIALELEWTLRRAGSEGLAFPSIVA
ncbi:MAG TPA: aminopeptidase P family N-terminal domain-containing protein, partial [Limnochordia bacterium]